MHQVLKYDHENAATICCDQVINYSFLQLERETTSTGRYLGLEMLEAIEPLAPPEHGFKH